MSSGQQPPGGAAIGDQPADPYKAQNVETEVTLQHKMDALLDFISRCRYTMMTTRNQATGLLASRCMELAATENNGTDLLFFTNTHTHKVDELAADPQLNLSFVSPSGEWASVAGSGALVEDRSLVRKHYTHTLRAWVGDLGDGRHDGSAEDPRLAMIRVRVETATFSLRAKGFFGTVKDVVAGAVTGKVAEVSRLTEITAEEVLRYRTAAGMVA